LEVFRQRNKEESRVAGAHYKRQGPRSQANEIRLAVVVTDFKIFQAERRSIVGRNLTKEAGRIAFPSRKEKSFD
jgi:hypothetical protein